MRILIIGAGRVGSHVADLAVKLNCDVTIIDKDKVKVKKIGNLLDIDSIFGDGTSSEILSNLPEKTIDIMLVATRDDITNITAIAVANTVLDIKKRVIRLKNRQFYQNEKLMKMLHIDRIIDIDLHVAKLIIDLMIIAPSANVIACFNRKGVIASIRVKNNNPYAMKKLKEINSVDFTIPLLYHLGNYEIANSESQIIPGDTAFIASSADKIDSILNDMLEDTDKIKTVSIIGGGRRGSYIAKYCVDNDISVKIIDRNPEVCDELSSQFPSAIVMLGSGSDIQLMKTEDLFLSDLFITTTDDDEMNILLSVLAKRIGVRKCITVAATEEYAYIASQLGLGSVVDPKFSSSTAILNLIMDKKAASISLLKGSKIGIIEKTVKSESPVINQLIEDIKFPSTSRIALILRRNDIIVPTGKEILIDGDQIIIFAPFNDMTKAAKLI